MEKFIVLKMDFKDLEEQGYASITDYCRFLVKEGKELPGRIEIYRGEMLCLSVNNVKIAATLEPTGSGFKKYTDSRQSKGRGRVKNEKGYEGST